MFTFINGKTQIFYFLYKIPFFDIEMFEVEII